MRSFYNPGKFFQKMKKKPALQAVLDNIENYDDEKIKALAGTHFPQWIKDELLELKKRNGKTAESTAQSIADQMIKASQK